MLSRLFTSVQTDPSRLFLSRRNSFSPFLSAESFSDGVGWEVFRHFAGPSDNLFSKFRFPAVKLATSLRGGLRETSWLQRCKRHFSQTLHGPRGPQSDLASLLGEARTSGSFLF